MSLSAYVWCAELPLNRVSGSAYRVLLLLADRADDLGYGAYPLVSKMADKLACSERTIQRGLRELVDEGLIREGDQRYVEHYDARYRPKVYDVLTTALVMTESRGDIPVTPARSRGDRSRHPGVTTVVAQEPSLNPLTHTSQSHLTLVTAHESEDQ
ncbi:MAG: helix-turn-helix domain-containing protein [Microbacterium ginsengisoli]|nr:helix-turn-helix domain-containing protein [Microbacterium ginsengisoli]